LITREYRRFVEFCNACQRECYIGLCDGPPGVGKTVSARHYAKCHLLEHRLPRDRPYLPLPPEVASCHTLFYTPEVGNTPRGTKEDIKEMRLMLNRFVEEAAHRLGDPPMMGVPPDHCRLMVVDEADRLKMPGLEQFRDIYDRGAMGLVLIGLPGLEKRMSRFAQRYSRVGFAHEFRTLSAAEMQFILAHHWERFGLRLEHTDFQTVKPLPALSGSLAATSVCFSASLLRLVVSLRSTSSAVSLGKWWKRPERAWSWVRYKPSDTTNIAPNHDR
jgi:DNA transposition AAA+ family ATPase